MPEGRVRVLDVEMKDRDFAKSLRQKTTPAEDRLWQELRGRRCGGYKFVRQQPISGYIVDFLCRRAHVVVELDGESHQGREDYDAQRMHDLERCGYQVMRLSNHDIYEDMSASVEAIFQFLEVAHGRGFQHPHPTASRPPSPSREKDRSLI